LFVLYLFYRNAVNPARSGRQGHSGSRVPLSSGAAIKAHERRTLVDVPPRRSRTIAAARRAALTPRHPFRENDGACEEPTELKLRASPKTCATGSTSGRIDLHDGLSPGWTGGKLRPI